MKRLFSLLIALVMVLSMTACGGNSEAPPSDGDSEADTGEKITFVCAHVDPEDSVAHRGMLTFKEYVEEHTGGRVDVQIYPNGQMGGERECIEAVALGSVQMTVATASVMSAYHEKFNLMELPFLFSDYDAVYEAYDGELGETFGSWMEEQNLLCKGYYCGGMRAISNRVRPVQTPADLKGLKIRCIESEMFMQLFQLLGTNPTPMNYNEVYTGLEQGTIDGQDNPATLTYTAKFYENLKYFTLTNHVALCVPLIVQKSFYEGLPEDVRTVLDEGFEVMEGFCREENLKFEQEAIDGMKEAGVECITLTEDQMQQFKDAVTPIYDQYREIVGDEVMDIALSY